MPGELATPASADAGILDSLTAQIAVLDGAGVITAVNEAWRRFGEDMGAGAPALAEGDWVGTSYLDTCRPGPGASPDDDAPAAARGIAEVLEGRREAYVLEYPCHSPERERWFVMNVTPLRTAGGGAVVAHYDITDRKLAEREREQALDRERRGRERAAFLADASQVLERSLDLRVVCAELARMTARLLDTAAVVDLLEGLLVTVRARAGREDADDPDALAAVADVAPALLPDAHPVARAAMTRQLVAAGDLGPAERRTIAVDDRHHAALETLGVRSYASVPLIARGAVIGVLSVHSAQPARFSPGDVADLRELGGRAALAVDNARLYSERTQTVRALQSSLLPPRLVAPAGVSAAARYRPGAGGMEVGGDFYDAFEARNGAWGVAIGDVCGKGAEAAALTSLARHTLRAAARYEASPVGVLAALNHAVLAERGDMRFLTAAYLELVPAPGGGARLRGSAGGHPPPIVLRAGGGAEAAAANGTLLGVIDDPELELVELLLAPGDALVLYTDGVTEAQAPARQLGWPEVAELAGSPEGDADDIAARIEDGVYRLAGGAPSDDVAVLVVKV